jgi:hypothetical protein
MPSPGFFPAASFFLLPKQLTYANGTALPGSYPVNTGGQCRQIECGNAVFYGLMKDRLTSSINNQELTA